MGVNLIFKIAAVGILVSVMCQVLKHSGREDQAFLTSLAGLILVLFWIVPYIYELFETIKNLFSLLGGMTMSVVQAALLGLTAILFAAQLKPLKPEYAVYLVLAASIGIGFLGLAKLGVLLETLREIGNGIRIRHVYLTTLLRMAGIAYIAEFTSGICKDAGYSAVGTQVEMVGKLAILAVSAPVVLSLVESLKVFME